MLYDALRHVFAAAAAAADAADFKGATVSELRFFFRYAYYGTYYAPYCYAAMPLIFFFFAVAATLAFSCFFS